MTLLEARQIYLAAGGDPYHEANQWGSIHREIEAVVAAPTLAAAADVIRWWDCWLLRREPAEAFARRVRSKAKGLVAPRPHSTSHPSG